MEDKKLLIGAWDAEESVLGSLLLNNDLFDEITDIITYNDFDNPGFKEIFKIMSEFRINKRPFDSCILADALPHLQVTIFACMHAVPCPTNIVAYSKIIKEKKILKKVFEEISHLQKKVLHIYQKPNATKTADESAVFILRYAAKIFADIENENFKEKSIGKLSDQLNFALSEIDRKNNNPYAFTGLETKYTALDEITNGLQKSDLIILAGRPSTGKTSLALNIAENVAFQKNSVLIFSLEMGAFSLTNRFLASSLKIPHKKILSGDLVPEDFSKIEKSLKKISSVDIFIDDSSLLTPIDLLSRARQLSKKVDLKLIVIDYLQLMSSDKKQQNRNLEIADITRSLKILAKEMNIPVIAISQLNRATEYRADKRPSLADLRDSGAIEQDADLVLLIHREEMYNKTSPRKGIADIIVAKHRNGETKDFNLAFLAKYSRFENLIML